MKSGGLFGGTWIKFHSRALSTVYHWDTLCFYLPYYKEANICCCCLIGYICDVVKTSNLNDKYIKDDVLNNKEIFK